MARRLLLLLVMCALTELATVRDRKLQAKPWCVDSRVEQAGLEWVLLIDDDPLNTRALSRWIKSEFATETRSARTIHQAACWLRSMPRPAAIITDFDLAAGETGAAALEHFRRGGVHVPAVVLTGAPTRARDALWRSDLRRVPVLSKTNFHEQLRAWLLAHTNDRRPALNRVGSRAGR